VFDTVAYGGAVIRLSDTRDDTAEMATLVYGDAHVGAWLDSVFAGWAARGARRVQEYTIIAVPADAPVSATAGDFVVEIPHWRLVFRAGKT
nr:hypothetical protein [Chloroflexota bacterium]